MPTDSAFWRNLSADAFRRIEAVRAEEERRLSRLRFKQPLDFMCEYEPFHSLHDGVPVFDNDTELDEFCFHNYILIVFLAFAEEARTMVRLGKWDIARVRSESMAFLREFARETYDTYGFDRHGGRLRAMFDELGDFFPEVAFRYRLSQGWRDFEFGMSDPLRPLRFRLLARP
jgi:hypothetical protein